MSSVEGSVSVEQVKGTYSLSGSNITMAYTQISGAMFEEMGLGLPATQWYNATQLRTAILKAMTDMGMSQAEAEAMLEEMGGSAGYNSPSGPF